MRRAVVVLGLLLASCVSDRILGLELRLPRAPDGGVEVPAEAATFEVRLSRLEGEERCATADEAASATEPGRLAHAQTFAAEDGMGMAIGEVPAGRWAVSAIARDADCAVLLHGCAEVTIDEDAPDVVVVELTASGSAETCGACRDCDRGACTPIAVRCE